MHSPFVCMPLFALLTLTIPMAGAENFRKQLTDTTEKYLHNKAASTAKKLNAEQFQVSIHPLAKQIKLPPCTTPIEVKDFNQTPYGEQLLQTICKDQWKLLVKANIQIFLPIIVSARMVNARKIIKEKDIEWQSRDISLLKQGYLTEPDKVLGKQAISTIKAGSPLNQTQLQTRTLLK